MAKYTVKQGDTLYAIAKDHGTNIQAIARANGISDPNKIQSGQTLEIGGSSTGGSGSSSTGGSNSGSQPTTFQYEAYKPSQAVTDAEALLQGHLANKPGSYVSPWQTQLNDTLDKILNREKFSYDMNGDALYQQYKDQYTTQGKMAMMDTMGQAAAMTGGYGNSYAQSAGQQAYQGYIQGLNDKMPELYQLALDQYNREGQELYNQYGLYADRDAVDYGRHRDTVSDYYTDLGILTDDARYKESTEYGRWSDGYNLEYGEYRDSVGDDQWNKSFEYQQGRDAVTDSQWQKSFDEGVRQFNESFKASTESSKTTSYGKLDIDEVEAKLAEATTIDEINYIVSLYKQEGYNPDTLATMARNALARLKKQGNPITSIFPVAKGVHNIIDTMIN